MVAFKCNLFMICTFAFIIHEFADALPRGSSSNGKRKSTGKRAARSSLDFSYELSSDDIVLPELDDEIGIEDWHALISMNSSNKEVSSSSTNLSNLTPQQKNEKEMKCINDCMEDLARNKLNNENGAINLITAQSSEFWTELNQSRINSYGKIRSDVTVKYVLSLYDSLKAWKELQKSNSSLSGVGIKEDESIVDLNMTNALSPSEFCFNECRI